MSDAVVSLNSSGLLTVPVPLNVGPAATLAAAGSVIGNAAAISSRFTVVTGADNTVGAILPSTARVGDAYFVYSSTATNGLKIYPPVNGDINDGSANAAVTIEGKTLGIFINMDGTTWVAMYTANS